MPLSKRSLELAVPNLLLSAVFVMTCQLMTTPPAYAESPLTMDILTVPLGEPICETKVAEVSPETIVLSPTEQAQASQYAQALTRLKPDGTNSNELRAILEKFSENLSDVGASPKSALLDSKIGSLEYGDQGKIIATSAIALDREIEKLTPPGQRTAASRIRGIVSRIPFVGTELEAYLQKIRKASGVINNIIKTIENSVTKANGNIQILNDGLIVLEAKGKVISNRIALAQSIRDHVQSHVNNLGASETGLKNFFETVVLVQLDEDIRALNLIKIANQQGIMARNEAIRIGRQTIRNTQLQIRVAIEILNNGVDVAVWADQNNSLIQANAALRARTSAMLLANAAAITTQGNASRTQRENGPLDMEKVKAAFDEYANNAKAEAEFLKTYLPKLKQNIDDSNAFIIQQEQEIARQRANRTATATSTAAQENSDFTLRNYGQHP